ncbi:MAG: uroporphyrinogen-III C-methyltransferase [Oxalobacteraceae bacterium]
MSQSSTPTSSVPPEPVATSAAAASAAHAAALVADLPAESAHPQGPTASSAAPVAEGGPPPQEAVAPSRWRQWQLRVPALLEHREARQRLAIGLLVLLLALQWWSSRTDISDLRRELAQRLQSGDNLNTQTKLIANRVDDEVKALQGKVAVLEAKQVESQSQQLALEQLYQDLAKNRDDWALAEVEQVLSTASQQLQLAGNVRGALIALQNADARLSRADRPQFIAVRRAIARDVDNLKSLPSVDLTGIAVRIDALIGQVDLIPLLSDEKPFIVAPSPKSKLSKDTNKEAGKEGRDAKAAKAGAEDDWRTALLQRWAAWSSELWNEIRQLVRVRSVNNPEALLLSPEEAFFARENLKLRLLNARMALLSRNDSAFRSDLLEADRALLRYFDTRARPTQAAHEIIRQLQDSVLNIDMPTLSHSLAAVRQSRSRP